MSDFKEGDKVTTNRGEPATVWFLHPERPIAMLTMDDQFMPDGGQALRTVRLDTLTKVTS